MSDLLASFDRDARLRVNEAVARAEERTSIEILPVVARLSGRYERAEDIVGLWCGVLLAGVGWVLFQGVEEDVGWAGESRVHLGFWSLVGLLALGFVLGVLAADRLAWLRRLFAPRREMQCAVAERAKAVFFDRKLHRTTRNCGVLLFVSLLERKCAVLVDQAVEENLGEKGLATVRDRMVSGLRGPGLAEGFVAAIDTLAELLVAELPAAEGQVNEVSNEVVVLDS